MLTIQPEKTRRVTDTERQIQFERQAPALEADRQDLAKAEPAVEQPPTSNPATEPVTIDRQLPLINSQVSYITQPPESITAEMYIATAIDEGSEVVVWNSDNLELTPELWQATEFTQAVATDETEYIYDTVECEPGNLEQTMISSQIELDIQPDEKEDEQANTDLPAELSSEDTDLFETRLDAANTLNMPDDAIIPRQLTAAEALTVAPVENSTDTTHRLRYFKAQLESHLQLIEPNQREAALPIIDRLGAVMKDIQQLPEASIPEQTIAEQELEYLCVQLCTCLDIECDEKIIQEFLQAATKRQLETHLETDEKKIINIQELNALGTYEYSRDGSISFLKALTRVLQQRLLPHLIVGRYALQFSG